ncbi:unnamed protein product [Tenebrio molitor]|nr:unnamed protein product [Tenebrio molitor]
MKVHPQIVGCIEQLMHRWGTRFKIRDGAASRLTGLALFRRDSLTIVLSWV